GAAQTLLEIIPVEAGLGHLVGAQLLAGNPRRAGRSDPAALAVIGAVDVGPDLGAVRLLGAVGHLVAQFARCVGGEQVRRQPQHVEMTIGRDSLVLHQLSLPAAIMGVADDQQPTAFATLPQDCCAVPRPSPCDFAGPPCAAATILSP